MTRSPKCGDSAMKSMIRAVAWAGALYPFGQTAVAQEPKPATDLAVRVQSIFAAKCSECHGPRLKQPRGGVTLHDLKRLAADADLVAPGSPERSALWEVIRDGEMPRREALAGPLSTPEKEAIHDWIASLPPVAPSQASPSTFDSSSPSEAPSLEKRVLGWFGRFHILVIHFPIALLAAAALGESIAAARRTWLPQPAVRYCVLLGAGGAVMAAGLGWLHADIGGHGGASTGILALHRWLGTTAALWAIGVALASERDNRRGEASVLFRLMLWRGAILVGATAHFGGLMV